MSYEKRAGPHAFIQYIWRQGVINTSKLAHAHLLFGWFWVSQYLTLAQRPNWRRLPTNILVKFNARACPNVHTTHRGELILQSTGFAGYSTFLLKNSRTILLSFPVRRRALQNYTDLPASVYTSGSLQNYV
jgi:hypothetical protein